jgi:hypothetical protein
MKECAKGVGPFLSTPSSAMMMTVKEDEEEEKIVSTRALTNLNGEKIFLSEKIK